MQKNDYQKLRECPFCGGEPSICELAETVNFVWCLNDNCSVKPDMMKSYSTLEEAIEAWNRRASDD